MLSHCANIELEKGNKEGRNALHLACIHSLDSVVQILIKQGMDVNAMTHGSKKESPLQLACQTKASKVISVLLAHDTHVDPQFAYFDTKPQMDAFLLTSEFTITTLLHNHSALWFHLISATDIDKVEKRVLYYASIYPNLATVVDHLEHVAVDIATPANKKAIKSVTLVHGRFRFLDLRPDHVSKTCFVYRASDEQDLDESKQPKKVALKLMRIKSQYKREITTRERGLSKKHVVLIKKTLPLVTDIDSWDEELDIDCNNKNDSNNSNSGETFLTKVHAEMMFCVVMPLADRNLFVALKQEQWAGSNMEQVKHVFLQIVDCVIHLHSKGILHADIKPLNLVRVDSQWKLIDLDACCVIGKDYVGFKSSTAYMPPEAIYSNRTTNQVLVKSEQNQKQYPSEKMTSLLLAHPSFDVWSLGGILYQMCTPDVRLLFQGGRDDNLSIDSADNDSLWNLAEWNETAKTRKLDKIPNTLVRNLLSQMLVMDPHKRASLERIRMHPFLSNNAKVVRLVGDRPKMQVFLSYRVSSDSQHVEKLYKLLTAKGLSVWWDKICLEPGVPWKEGFCAGLVNSDCFVCLLSRGAINHPDKAWQNFSKLEKGATCDNVFLEHRMALELKALGLIRRVLPVFIGDADNDANPTNFGPFFEAGCLPRAADTHVISVEQDLREHMANQALGTPLEETRTVKEVLAEITSNQGSKIEGDAQAAFVTAADYIEQMVRLSEQDAGAGGGTVLDQSSSSSSSSSYDDGTIDYFKKENQNLKILLQALLEENKAVLAQKDAMIRHKDEQLAALNRGDSSKREWGLSSTVRMSPRIHP